MSIAADANLLLYASDASSRFHDPARLALQRCAKGPRLFYLFWPVTMAYLRVATHASIFTKPLSPSEARANVSKLLELPHVISPGEGERFWASFAAVSDERVLRGNLVPDAHIVALMREYGVRTIVSHDRDLRGFDDIEVVDPFE